METYEVRRPPQTAEDERDCVIRELAELTAAVYWSEGTMPARIEAMLKKDGAMDLQSMSALQLADLCADIRSEYPGLPREANERR